MSGRVISTGDGNITADGLQDIRLHGGGPSRPRAGGQLETDTGEPRRCAAVRRARPAHRRQGIEADAGRLEGDRRLVAAQRDGGIAARAEDLSAELDAHTGDGHITLDLPVTVAGTISPSTVRGKLGAGGPPLRVQTGDGSIRLQKL